MDTGLLMRTGILGRYGKKDTVLEYIDVVINRGFLIFLQATPYDGSRNRCDPMSITNSELYME
jgi:hypothetical protein